MKKKTKLLIALLLVFVGVGLTYAVYTTSVGGNANVSAANWLIKVKTGSDFDNQAGIDVSNGANNVNLGNCEKLAPGGSCTLPFRVDATGTEVDTILTVELGSNVSGATLEELTNAGINLRISDGVNEDYAYLLNMGSYKDLNLVINWEAGDEDDDEKAAADVSIANKLSSITIPVNMIVKQRLGGLRTVTFNTHDNNIETPEPIQVNDGNSISEANIPVLEKSGYIFDGWYTSEVGGTKLTSSTIIINNIEYHARFRERQNFTISFNSDGGSNVNSVNVLEGGTLSELPSNPTKLGYAFLGWFDENNNELTLETVINNNITYTAHWEVSRDYSMAGTLIYYDPVSDATCNSTTYTGSNTCYKWRILSGNINGYDVQIDHGLKPSTGNVIWNTGSDNTAGPLKALESLSSITSTWTRVPVVNYEYDTSEATNSYGKLTCVNGVCNITKNETTTPTAGTAANPLRARLITVDEIAKINGNNNWSLSNQVNINSLPSWMNENMSAEFAYWTLTPTTDKAKAYFVRREGRIDSYSISYASGDRYLRPIIRIKPNIKVTFNFQDGVTQNIERNYTLLDTSGSTPVVNNLGTLPVPSERSGYLFVGWFDSYNNKITNNSTVPSANATYYAHWGEIRTVTFDSNDGSSVSPVQVGAGGTLDSIPTSERSGYEFMGWYDANDNKLTLDTIINSDITYTARWRIDIPVVSESTLGTNAYDGDLTTSVNTRRYSDYQPYYLKLPESAVGKNLNIVYGFVTSYSDNRFQISFLDSNKQAIANSNYCVRVTNAMCQTGSTILKTTTPKSPDKYEVSVQVPANTSYVSFYSYNTNAIGIIYDIYLSD